MRLPVYQPGQRLGKGDRDMIHVDMEAGCLLRQVRSPLCVSVGQRRFTVDVNTYAMREERIDFGDDLE
jgi:hypothetical protein